MLLKAYMARNSLLQNPPFLVEQALKHLGASLRTARLRRHQTIAQVAEKIGTGPRAVRDAEKGKPSTGIGIYTALLWAYDLLQPLENVANPANDEQGLTLADADQPKRARKSNELTNDF